MYSLFYEPAMTTRKLPLVGLKKRFFKWTELCCFLSNRMVEDDLELPSSLESAATKIELLDDSVLVGEAGKMSVLLSLVDQLRQDGHRSLIFSQSRKILDIIQKVLRNRVGHGTGYRAGLDGCSCVTCLNCSAGLDRYGLVTCLNGSAGYKTIPV